MPTPIPPTAPRAEAGPGRTAERRRLWDQVVEARGLVASQRHLPVDRSFVGARVELLVALEAYAASLASHGRPIPYALRDDLRLQRLTCSADRSLRYDSIAGRLTP